MATFDWPDALTPRSVSWGIQKAGVQFRSPMAGSVESIEFPGQFWRVSVVVPGELMKNGSSGEAFFGRIAGGVDRVRVPYWQRLRPLGTMRGTPTLQISAARGDLQLLLSAAGTLRRGDMIGVGPQLFQVFADCADVSGTLTVPLVNRVRGPIAAGMAVLWDRPTMVALIPSLQSSRSYEPGEAQPLPVDLEEVP